MGFLELQQERGVYSQVTAGMDVRNSTWFSEVRIPVLLGRTLQEAKLGLQDNTDASRGEVGDHSPLSSFHRDIGIPINFQEESGLDPFRNTELSGTLEVSSDVRTPLQMRWDIGFSLGTAQSIQTSLYIVRRKTSLHSSHCQEIRLLSVQGISVSTAREAANSGSLSHTDC